MTETLLESTPHDEGTESQFRRRMALGVIAALLVSGLVFSGYAYLRKRHEQQTQLAAAEHEKSLTPPARGPVRAEIRVDDAMIKGDQILIGGVVRNISSDNLTGLSVDLELKRRRDGTPEKVSVPVAPTQLSAQQEGHYSLEVRSADYSNVKVVGLKETGDVAIIYNALPGQKRPPERLESKEGVVKRPGSKDEFYNTPDNPGRLR
jgi:hypothetical protein